MVLLFPKFYINLVKWQVVSETVGDYLDKAREEELVEEKVVLKRSQVGHMCVCSASAMCAGAGHCDQGEWTQLLFHCWIYKVGTSGERDRLFPGRGRPSIII